MLDGSALPAELALDRNSGRFNLTNLATGTVDYRIKLVITNTGGSSVPYTGEGDVSAIYNSVHELEFHVKTECGLASTTLTPPNLRPLYSTPGFEDDRTLTAFFETSNPTCPVESHLLLSGVRRLGVGRAGRGASGGELRDGDEEALLDQIGRASCRERV